MSSPTNDVLAYVEVREGAPKKSAAEVLTAGRLLADQLGGRLVALLVGAGAATAAALGRHGADRVLVVEGAAFARATLEAHGAAVQAALAACSPRALLLSASVVGKELGAWVAGTTGRALAADVLSVELRDGRLVALKPKYAGKALAQVALAGPAVVSLRPNATPVREAARTAAVEALAVLSENLSAAGREFADPTAVSTALLAASRSDVDGLRSAAAFTLGVVGGDPARERLVELVDDADDAVRFNAAIGLVRQGRPEAWDACAEMLSLPDVSPPPGDRKAQAERYRRAMIVVNAIKALGRFIDVAGSEPPARIVDLVGGLQEDAAADVRVSAKALSERIGRGRSEPAANR